MPCEHRKCVNGIEKQGKMYHPVLISSDNQIFIKPSNLGWVVKSTYGHILEETRRPFVMEDDIHLLQNGFSIEMIESTSIFTKIFGGIKKLLGYPSTNLKPVLFKNKMVIIIDK